MVRRWERAADSRFASRDAAYTMLYAAPEFGTAFIEAVVRDRLVRRIARTLAVEEVTGRIWVRVSARAGQSMTLLDLRGDGCQRIGAPTDVVPARSHAAGRAFGNAIHGDHANVDGLLYESRLTGRDAYAVFDRAMDKLEVMDMGTLADHTGLPVILARYAISLVQ